MKLRVELRTISACYDVARRELRAELERSLPCVDPQRLAALAKEVADLHAAYERLVGAPDVPDGR